jgi:hypothetical protein
MNRRRALTMAWRWSLARRPPSPPPSSRWPSCAARSSATAAGIDPSWDGTIPAFFAYDRDGKLRRVQVGEMSRDIFDAFVGDLAVKK